MTLLQECSPSASQGGSYLMYTYSVSGYDVNNKVEYIYSRCNFYRKYDASDTLTFLK